MIKANDLRPGCWIKTANGYEQVIDVLCDSVNTKTLQNELYENIEGVLITKEMFQNIPLAANKGYITVYENLDFFHNDEGVNLDLDINDWECVGVKTITPQPLKYVHQLQNWFYLASGGTELSITL